MKVAHFWWDLPATSALLLVHSSLEKSWTAFRWNVVEETLTQGNVLTDDLRLEPQRCSLSSDGKFFVQCVMTSDRSLALVSPPDLQRDDVSSVSLEGLDARARFHSEIRDKLIVYLPNESRLSGSAGNKKKGPGHFQREQNYIRLRTTRERLISQLERTCQSHGVQLEFSENKSWTHHPRYAYFLFDKEIELSVFEPRWAGYRIRAGFLEKEGGATIGTLSKSIPPSRHPTSPARRSEFCRCNEVERGCRLMTLGNRKSCCWCADRRTLQQQLETSFYLDSVGDVRPADHGIQWPLDAEYCDHCRRNETRARLPMLLRELIDNRQ